MRREIGIISWVTHLIRPEFPPEFPPSDRRLIDLAAMTTEGFLETFAEDCKGMPSMKYTDSSPPRSAKLLFSPIQRQSEHSARLIATTARKIERGLYPERVLFNLLRPKTMSTSMSFPVKLT